MRGLRRPSPSWGTAASSRASSATTSKTVAPRGSTCPRRRRPIRTRWFDSWSSTHTRTSCGAPPAQPPTAVVSLCARALLVFSESLSSPTGVATKRVTQWRRTGSIELGALTKLTEPSGITITARNHNFKHRRSSTPHECWIRTRLQLAVAGPAVMALGTCRTGSCGTHRHAQCACLLIAQHSWNRWGCSSPGCCSGSPPRKYSRTFSAPFSCGTSRASSFSRTSWRPTSHTCPCPLRCRRSTRCPPERWREGVCQSTSCHSRKRARSGRPGT